jgi:hypothetical protein
MLPSTLVTHGGRGESRTHGLALIRRRLHTNPAATRPYNLVAAVRFELTTLRLYSGVPNDRSSSLGWQTPAHPHELRSRWQGMKDSNPQISLWRRAVCAISLIPRKISSHFSKSNKKPGLSRVWCAPHEMHSDPQDTTPQMTRLLVILTMSRLKVLNIASIHRDYFRSLTVA